MTIAGVLRQSLNPRRTFLHSKTHRKQWSYARTPGQISCIPGPCNSAPISIGTKQHTQVFAWASQIARHQRAPNGVMVWRLPFRSSRLPRRVMLRVPGGRRHSSWSGRSRGSGTQGKVSPTEAGLRALSLEHYDGMAGRERRRWDPGGEGGCGECGGEGGVTGPSRRSSGTPRWHGGPVSSCSATAGTYVKLSLPLIATAGENGGVTPIPWKRKRENGNLQRENRSCPGDILSSKSKGTTWP